MTLLLSNQPIFTVSDGRKLYMIEMYQKAKKNTIRTADSLILMHPLDALIQPSDPDT